MVRRFRILVARLIAALVFRGPVKLAGGRLWFYPARGVILPAQAGAEGDGEGGSGDADADAGTDADKDADADKSGDSDKDGDAESDLDADADADGDKPAELAKWRKESRKHERRAKAEREAREALQKKLDEIEASNKSEQEKAIDKARAEAKTEAEQGYAEQRRDDKVENAVTKLALKGFKVKDGDEERTLKFADPDDAQLRLERAIRQGDLSYDDIYADGKVKTDAVTEFLSELLEENTHLQASDGEKKPRKVAGDADAGKGKGTGKELEEMSPDDHLKAIQGRS